MKNKLVKMMAMLTATTMVAAGVMGCGGSDDQSANAGANTDTQTTDNTDSQADAEANTDEGTDLSGTVTLAGSTSMEKLSKVRKVWLFLGTDSASE